MVRVGWGRHSTVATGSDSGDQVSVNAWNADVSQTGILGFVKQSAIISTNAITPSGTIIEIQATGTLNTVTPTDNNEFDLIYLFAASGATVTLTHDATGGAGKIRLLSGINKTLSTTVPTILVCRTISSNKEWVEYGGGVTNSIDDIGDVTITSVAAGDVLKYNGSAWVNNTPDLLSYQCKNTSGSTIAKGKAVYITGYDVGTGYPEIALADHASASTMPALGITNESIANNASGEVIQQGKLSDIDTSAFTANTILYVNASGGLTATKPTGTNKIQNIGLVLRSHNSNGQIQVGGAGRINDIPNIPNGQAWIGNASGVPTATTLATSATTDTTNASNISSGTLPLARLSGITTTELSATAGITNDQLAGSIAQSKITNLTSDLAAKAPLASPTFTGTVTLPSTDLAGNNLDNIQNLIHDQSAISYNATLAFDFDADQEQTLALTGDLTTLTTSNRAAGKSKTVYITGDSSNRTLTFNTSWRTNPSGATVTITANTFGVLVFGCRGTAETDVYVGYTEFA